MKKKWINVLLFCLISFYTTAQTEGYKYYSRLDSVIKPGFYNIELTPGLNARLKTDFSDLRIVNDAGKWVPHILHAPASEYSNTAVVMDLKFSITGNSVAATTLIIEGSKKPGSNLGLVITNTAAERFCTLSGSDDRKNWFVINDSILLNPVPAEKETENTFRINFPANNYLFYKVIIHNNNKDPFNIKGVVEYTTGAEITNLYKIKNENPATTILQKDSGKISYLKITQQLPYPFDYVSLQLSGVKYYSRTVDLYIPYDEKSSFSNPGRLLQSFTVSNNSTLLFKLPVAKATVFYLLIRNEDNLPLTVKEVKTARRYYHITAYLDSGSNYRLIMDNKTAGMPNYDLTKLNSKIPDSISFLRYGEIAAFPPSNVATPVPQNNNWILWTAIAAALLILILFTYKMLKEVDKRKAT